MPPRGTETNYSRLTNLLAALPYLEPADTLFPWPGNHRAAKPRWTGPPAPSLTHHAPKLGRRQGGCQCFTPPARLGQWEQTQAGKGKGEKPAGQGRSHRGTCGTFFSQLDWQESCHAGLRVQCHVCRLQNSIGVSEVSRGHSLAAPGQTLEGWRMQGLGFAPGRVRKTSSPHPQQKPSPSDTSCPCTSPQLPP